MDAIERPGRIDLNDAVEIGGIEISHHSIRHVDPRAVDENVNRSQLISKPLKQLRDLLNATLAKLQVLVDSAEKERVAYDQLIGQGNAEGNAKVMAAIKALLAQTKGIEKAVLSLGLGQLAFEGSDSLDQPETVTH